MFSLPGRQQKSEISSGNSSNQPIQFLKTLAHRLIIKRMRLNVTFEMLIYLTFSEGLEGPEPSLLLTC